MSDWQYRDRLGIEREGETPVFRETMEAPFIETRLLDPCPECGQRHLECVVCQREIPDGPDIPLDVRVMDGE